MPSPQEFSLPKLSETYIEQVIQRCEDLIESRIWAGLSKRRLQAWVGNFSSILDKYLAARILDALIYRSRDQTHALIQQLFDRILPAISKEIAPMGSPPTDWKELLSGRADPFIRMVPVLRDSDPPTKSGTIVARMFKKHLGLNNRWFIWPWQIKEHIQKGAKLFLFLDDFVGTGDQFDKFVERFELNALNHIDGAQLIYAPLAGHETGLSMLRKTHKHMHIEAAEVLTAQHCLFSPTSPHFEDGKNTPLLAKEHYLKIIDRKNIDQIRRTPLGYGDLGLAYAFEHSVPNATLPLLWTSDPNVCPLFDR